MCYNYAIRLVLDQWIDNKSYVIYYPSHTLYEVQMNYTVIKNEFLAVVFGFKKFRPYVIGPHVIIFTDLVALKHFFQGKDAKPRLI